MRFEWDEDKNHANFRKHGVRFGAVMQVFNDTLARWGQDRFVNGEERWWIVGMHNNRFVLRGIHD